MPFAHRDQNGKVQAIYAHPQPGAEEELPINHPEIISFLTNRSDGNVPILDLAESDTEMARVIEDLVELLVLKGVIAIEELPGPAQRKLQNRQKWRGSLEDALAAFGGGKVI